MAEQQQGSSETSALTAVQTPASERQQLNVGGFDYIGVCTGGEEHWHTRLWEIGTVAAGLYSHVAEVNKAAEAHECKNTKAISDVLDELLEMDETQHIEALCGTRWSGCVDNFLASYSRKRRANVQSAT